MTNLKEKYERQIDREAAGLAEAKRRFTLLGVAKLAALAAVIGLTAAAFSTGRYVLWLPLAGGMLAALAALWVVHIHVHRQVNKRQRIIELLRRYLDRIDGRWTAFEDTGDDVAADTSHPYARDLDILGPKSLFQLLNVAHTWHGRQAFARDLLEAPYTPEQIRERQAAAAELAGETALAGELQYYTEQVGSQTWLPELVRELADGRPYVRRRWVRALLLWAPLGVAAFFAAAHILRIPALLVAAYGLLLAQGIGWLVRLPSTRRYFAAVKSPYIFNHYASVMKVLADRRFEAPLLRGIREELACGVKAIEQLDSIVSKVRGGNILSYILNVFLLWDMRCCLRLSDWKAAYGDRCEGWLAELGRFESLLSLAGLSGVCAGTCLPVVAADGGAVRARGLGHPLLPNAGRVCNDMELARGDVWIISGSNMSGKTTFLRTVGVNLVLARAGAAVCAEEMACSLFTLVSSMRITDDLNEGISTFYAELRQIKAVVQAAKETEDLFFLIDELFRGTNSEDRLFGAAAVIRELCGRRVTGILTTHDLSLCAIEEEFGNLRNYSFSEQYDGDDMQFDYRLQPGKSRTTNARYLMRQVGILES